jgi:hypothetical protein
MRRRFVVFVVAVSLAAGLTACGEDDPKRPPAADLGPSGPPPPTGGGGSGEGGVTDGGAEAGDGGVCNDLVVPSLVVDRIGINGDPPVGTGGVIAEGDYDLTRFDVYVGVGGVAGPTGITAQSTIRVAGTTLDQVIRYAGTSAPQELRARYAFSVSSATLALTGICPAGGAASRQYTSNGVTLVVTDTVAKEVFTFTKR